MKLFNINEYKKTGSIILTKKILIHKYFMSEIGAKNVLRNLVIHGDIQRIGVDKYIIIDNILSKDILKISNYIDEYSYVSLYSVLERQIIKQAHRNVFCITTKGDRGYNIDINDINIKYFFSKIPLSFGLYYDDNNIYTADNERALLDLIYLHRTAHLPIWSELYLKGHIDQNKITQYLLHYPTFVSNFYNKTLKKYEKQ